MIVTVTPNPSIDRTVTLGTPLTRGAVHRVTSATTEPGGKGVNVARALTLAGLDALAVLPAADADPIVAALQRQRRDVPVRPGHRRRAHQPRDHRIRRHHNQTQRAGGRARRLGPRRAHPCGRRAPPQTRPGWCCPAPCRPACPTTGTPRSSRSSRPPPCRIAVDTSERPLDALAASFGRAAPDVIKPNAEELAGLVGASPEELERAAAAGDPEPVVVAARQLIDRGANAVLVTLGAAGAVLVDQTRKLDGHTPADRAAQHRRRGRQRRWPATSAPRSAAPSRPQRLQMAVAYGSAAAALPGSALPSPAQIDLEAVRVYAITPASTHP